MTVTLLHNSPLYMAAHGARTCWESHDKSDTKFVIQGNAGMTGEFYCDDSDLANCTDIITGPADAELIDRVGNKFRHQSILEHLVYTFYIEGISRACLQELSRHRMASPSVKSTRYTLKELKSEEPFTDYTDIDHQEYTETGRQRAEKYLVMTTDERVNRMTILALDNLRDLVQTGISNDLTKYALPEAYKVSEQLTINARSLQNFLSLRSDKSALWEIRNLAHAIYNALPTEHQYLFQDCMKEP